MGFKNKQDRYKNMEHKFEDMKKEVIGFVTTAMADQVNTGFLFIVFLSLFPFSSWGSVSLTDWTTPFWFQN